MLPVTKAILPVAGLGTRFLPATKAIPKEMLPLVDKPLIQYAIEESVAAGITELIFITNGAKKSIEEHFSPYEELEKHLLETKKIDLLEQLKGIIPEHVKCTYVTQEKPLGLGHAILCAKSHIGNQPFAVLLADDFIFHEKQPAMQELVEMYKKVEASVIAVEEVDRNNIEQYGVISPEKTDYEYLFQVNDIVEKPQKEHAPSNFGVVGRYILTPRIFEYLERCEVGRGGELQLTDGIHKLLTAEKVYAMKLTGERYDCGSKLNYLKAIVQVALQRPDLRQDFTKYLKSLNL